MSSNFFKDITIFFLFFLFCGYFSTLTDNFYIFDGNFSKILRLVRADPKQNVKM